MENNSKKENPMNEKNDCYKCPYREKLPHSAHSKCNVLDGPFAISISMKVARGEVTKIDNYEGHSIEFHPNGVENGWCMWPLDYDPVWVKCHLPIKVVES